MTDEPVETEVVSEDEHLLPAVRPTEQVTLFRTDDPVEVVKRATEVANALSSVLRTQRDSEGKLKLISTISGREHVRVEGWTLCGTMLGVFAVPVWTRRVTDPDEGWEARVEARTLDGHVVGAAEAQCTRAEKQWSYEPTNRYGKPLEARDDFALRSMAQTRAVSKALRLPLGFIVELAGFSSTPAEEMGEQESQQMHRVEGPPAFPVPKNWKEIEASVRTCDNQDEAWALFQAFLRAATYHLFGETDQKKLNKEQKMVLVQKAAGAAVWLNENIEYVMGELFLFTEDKQRAAWAHVLDGSPQLEIPDYEPPEKTPAEQEAEEIDEEAARIARESFADEGPYA